MSLVLALAALVLAWAGRRWRWPYAWQAAQGLFGLAVVALLAHAAVEAIRYAGLTGSLRRMGETLLAGSAWALCALALTWLGLHTRQAVLKRFGVGLLLVAVARVTLGGYGYLPPEPLLSIRSLRMLAVLAVVGCALHVRRLLLRAGSAERVWLTLPDWLLAAATLAGWVLVGGETVNHFETRYIGLLRTGASQEALRAVADQQTTALSVVWLIYALAVGGWRRLPVLRCLATGLLALGIVKVLVQDPTALAPPARILALVGLGIFLITAALRHRRHGRARDGTGSASPGRRGGCGAGGRKKFARKSPGPP